MTDSKVVHCQYCGHIIDDLANSTYKIKTMEVGGDIYEDVEVASRRSLIEAIEQHKVIAICEKGKKIYINAGYIVSFGGTKEEEL